MKTNISVVQLQLAKKYSYKPKEVQEKAGAFNSFFASVFVNEKISFLLGFQVDTNISISLQCLHIY